jgi:hypothetical protein
MAQRGSVPTGPSEDYLRLLKREISVEEYAKSVERRLREDRSDRGARSSNGAQRQRA